ncbi:MAG: gamma carbonic anhydrase family protein [archaeon]|nr:gamma carbonic anhydrase family protein [archaeon]
MTVYAFGNKKPKIHPTAWIHPNADVTGKVNIGSKVYVGSGAVIRGDLGKINIDNGSAVLENVTIQASPSQKINIGKNVTLSVGAILHNCIIHDNAMIGMGAIISDNVEVGEGAIVAEGSVVRSKTRIETNTIVAGVPAKVIGEISESKKSFIETIPKVYQGLTQKYPEKLRILNKDEYEWNE